VSAADPLLHPWWARLSDGEPGRPARQTLIAVLSPDFPAHTIVDLPGSRRPTGWQVAVTTEDGRLDRVAVALPDAPMLWYVELPEPTAVPPATTLVAFSDLRRAEGEVLSEPEAWAAGVSGADQVAAVRWWPADGLVHQVYVQPSFRRRRVAAKLVQAAGGVQAARGLPAMHGDGRRTDLGEQWRAGLPGYLATRLAPRTYAVPPMTPDGEPAAMR
jgi:GNAT superfamily N-acetyltransferase